ncbi:uncharacterized protein C15orf39-like [Sapajus apella]|uniref:Uncharacterized protein C15orf39-like n=1 Tax=Sapajus apella TaxID=9515 RepID=A0A6J3HHP6_SAPAP|nr:uncharacterized protein C15orf39-like [Sapajus apella]
MMAVLCMAGPCVPMPQFSHLDNGYWARPMLPDLLSPFPPILVHKQPLLSSARIRQSSGVTCGEAHLFGLDGLASRHVWGRGDFDTEAGAVSSSEPAMARYEPERLALAQKSPAPKVRKPGRKPPSPGPEKAAAAAAEESRDASATPAASASPPGPTLKARFCSLLETTWLSGLALPTWGHKTSRPDRPPPRPQLLDRRSPHL